MPCASKACASPPSSSEVKSIANDEKSEGTVLRSPQRGCCTDCGSGKTSCDDDCIRQIALIACQAAHGDNHLDEHSSSPEDEPHPCTAGTPANDEDQKSPAGGARKGHCCDAKLTTEEDDVESKGGSRCAGQSTSGQDEAGKEKRGCCPGEEEKTGCSSANEKKTGCSSANEEKIGCCSSEKDKTGCSSRKKEKSGCSSRKEEKTACCSDNNVCPSEPVKKASGGIKARAGCCDTKKSGGCCSTADGISQAALGKSKPCDDAFVEVRSRASSCSTAEQAEGSIIACSSHLQKAFDDYLGQLERGLCICRSALDRLDACCGSALPKIGDRKTRPRASRPLATTPRGSRPVSEDKCFLVQPDRTKAELNENGCTRAVGNSCTKAKEPEQKLLAEPKDIDVEKAAAREHIVYRVSGMTCTGCSKKIDCVLGNVDGISSAKVTFVTAIAEFDLDQNVLNVEQATSRLEKETGFKFSRIISLYQTLDLKTNVSVTEADRAKLQKLVESFEVMDKTTYRVSYDPLMIGARDLISSMDGFELAPPGTDASLAEGKKRLKSMSWATAVAAVLTIPVVVLAWSDTSIPEATSSTVELVLATLVQAIAVPEFYIGAVKALVHSRVLEMDMLVVISITAAYDYSVVAFALARTGYTLDIGAFFETSCLLITLVLLGRLVGAFAKVRAISTVSVRSLQTQNALLLNASEENTEIDARLLQYGDFFVVPAHATIVTDGEVSRGQSAVDESMLTGESIPVPKGPGDEVIAGTINGSTALTVRLSRLPGKNSISDIANLVENALAAKARVQDLADKIAGYFVPVVITIALIVFGIWMGVATKVRQESGGTAVGTAITYGIAVLAISCPCALGLAVPMVLVIAGGVAAKSGVIIKQADAIERGHKVTDVVFDKTGTLTMGNLSVVHHEVFEHSEISRTEILALVKALVKDNQHPVSLAVAAHGDVSSASATEVDESKSVPGAGVLCTWRGSQAKAGNPYWLRVEKQPELAGLVDSAMTFLCVTVDSTLVATFGLTSTVRNEAAAVVQQLNHRKIQCHIVSGDGPNAVEDVAQAVGIPISNIVSRRKPAEKQEYVKALMTAGRTVLFCGDGTNDAVAVAQANIGVQIGTTSDVTRASADVVLLGGLDGIPTLLELSKRSFRRIAFHFAWSAIYNVFAILLTAGAFVKVRIPPAYAGLGELVSVLPVVVAAVSLMRRKRST